MGWLERLLPFGSRTNVPGGEDPGISSYDPAQRVLANPYEPFVGGLTVADPGVPLSALTKADIERYWATQPNLRKVVSFIARNVGGIPMNLYDRKGDTDRVRVFDSPLARALDRPGHKVSPFRLWESVVSDGCLYDRWVIQVVHEKNGSISLVRMPAWRVRIKLTQLGLIQEVLFWLGDAKDLTRGTDSKDPNWVPLDLDTIVVDHGYAPRTAGLSPVETLRATMDEQSEATKYRQELLNNGPRVPAWIERPKDAARWKDDRQRQRFIEGIRDYVTGGASAGGWPLIEDGMVVHDRKVLTPQEVSDVEGRTWSNVEVTTAFHISPEIIGVRPGTFANVDAFRQMLYSGAQLGPYVDALEGALNTQLLDIIPGSAETFYIEANVESKLRGSFTEQAQVKQSATGAPWLTRNEARAMENRPPVPGGDELVVPLNVLVGGLASPRDTAPDRAPAAAPAEPPADDAETPSTSPEGEDTAKAAPGANFKAADVERAQLRRARREALQAKYEQELGRFFRKQNSVVRAALGRKTPGYWDEKRWDNELTELMLKLHLATSTRAARDALEAAGVDPDEYDPDRTINYLTAVAKYSGRSINEKTLSDIQDALADDEDPDAALDAVLEGNETWRLAALAAGATTTAIGFGMHEAAGQTRAATKTWITGPNPRPEHAAMDGETVPVSENFSNGLAWPGDPTGGADDLAGCNCELQFNY